jgi:GT2 family glycosyltransferase
MKTLSIAAVAYKRPDALPILIHSLKVQTSNDFILTVYHDGYDQEMSELFLLYKEKYPEFFDYRFSELRYNDWGHSLRATAIMEAKSPYLLITNDDNYYCPTFVEEMLSKIQEDESDIVICDMLHSHFGYKKYFRTFPKSESIDIGAIICRTELAQKVGWKDKGFGGDGTYCEDLLYSQPKIKVSKVKKTLFVHN